MSTYYIRDAAQKWSCCFRSSSAICECRKKCDYTDSQKIYHIAFSGGMSCVCDIFSVSIWSVYRSNLSPRVLVDYIAFVNEFITRNHSKSTLIYYYVEFVMRHIGKMREEILRLWAQLNISEIDEWSEFNSVYTQRKMNSILKQVRHILYAIEIYMMNYLNKSHNLMDLLVKADLYRK